VFGFVNAPLLATFLLGMFWKRTTGHGAFFGLLGGRLTAVFSFHSEMGQNFYVAIVAWSVCMLLTVAISLATRPLKSDDDLRGLVYSLTPRTAEASAKWYQRPAALASLILVATLLLNLVFL
jgi:SSS family solute:Na+ symporter